MTALKTVSINLFVLTGLALTTNIAAGWWLDRKASTPQIDGSRDARATAPAYSDQAYAKRIFHDFYLTVPRYSSYDGVRLEPFVSDTVNIGKDGLRITPGQPNGATKFVNFFGGSTAWGTGVDDAHTIPALLQRDISDSVVTNYGQSGFVSGQSLAALMKIISTGGQVGTVIFYDGINDIFHLCQERIPLDGHPFTYFLDQAVRSYRASRNVSRHRAWTATFGNFVELAAVLGGDEIGSTHDISQIPGSRCGNPSAVSAVADILWRNWLSAKALVEANGGHFVAILQPVAAVGIPKRDYLPPSPEWDNIFRMAYDNLRQHMAAEGAEWAHDLSAAFDGNEPLYIDQMHVAAAGNERIAKAILRSIGDRPDIARPGHY